MKVVSLDGTPIGNPHEPDEDVVTFLRQMLEAAESGEINGVCVAVRHSDGALSSGISGMVGEHGVIGVLEEVKASILALMREPIE